MELKDRKTELQKLEEELEQHKEAIFDHPKRVAYLLGENYWENQSKDVFKFACKLVTILRVIDCKMEKFGKEIEHVNYD